MQMTKYVPFDEIIWSSKNIRGTPMEGATIWNDGFGFTTKIFRMPKGMVILKHRHDIFVQVAVVSGQIHVDKGDKLIGPGGLYFVRPGEVHTETAMEDTVLVVTKMESEIDLNSANEL